MNSGTETRETQRLNAIITIHHCIGTSLELEEIGRVVVRELVSIVGCDGCAILLLRDDKACVLAESGFSDMFGHAEFDAGMPAIDHIVCTQEAIFTGDVPNSPAAGCVPAGCSMASLICVPIKVEDKVVGIIHLDSAKKDAFDQADVDLAGLLAKEIAIAVERSFAYAEVQDHATRDGLTGSFNRRKFDVDIVARLAEAECDREPLSLVLVDVDWFKSYNDSHGHQAGDELLKALAGMFSEVARPGEGPYRYGGEEFAFLLPLADSGIALGVAERLRAKIAAKHFEGAQDSQPLKKITISLGTASYPADAKDRNALIAAADKALYNAKENGRDRVCRFSDMDA
ncbi:MAG: sensor domain-containing diguanylate cyclase [Verrucomicrobia bacterium]|nr:sensor domain-containing diguanylate cyclase [Verrucomicrobiota bacterium]